VLEKLPLIEFRTEPDGFRWKLGNVNFVNSPDLLWTDNGYWNVLDFNSYLDGEELLRHAELYRAYIWRFMRIAPEAVLVHNHDLFTRKFQTVERSCEDFRDVFLKFAGEAAMWRDYLLRQDADVVNNIWHYAQKDRCSCCRFEQLFPANGTYKNV
jgi:hypothetical protein